MLQYIIISVTSSPHLESQSCSPQSPRIMVIFFMKNIFWRKKKSVPWKSILFHSQLLMKTIENPLVAYWPGSSTIFIWSSRALCSDPHFAYLSKVRPSESWILHKVTKGQASLIRGITGSASTLIVPFCGPSHPMFEMIICIDFGECLSSKSSCCF